jgi:hypothetical protein
LWMWLSVGKRKKRKSAQRMVGIWCMAWAWMWVALGDRRFGGSFDVLIGVVLTVCVVNGLIAIWWVNRYGSWAGEDKNG